MKNITLNVTHHSPFNGAITDIISTPGGRKLLTTGYDGVINMYQIKAQAQTMQVDSFKLPVGSFKISISGIFGIEQQIKKLKEIWASREYERGEEDGFQADDGVGYEETSLVLQIKAEQAKAEARETKEYQSDIVNQIHASKDEFMALVKANEEAPELEKLTTADFTLDTVTAERLEQLGQIRAELVHDRRQVKNQMRSLMAQTVADKCFQRYEPRLTTIFSFKTPIKFDNFPLPVQDEKMMAVFGDDATIQS